MNVRTLTSLAELEAIAPQWDDLIAGMARPSPFVLSTWLDAWWRVYGEANELTIHVAERDGSLVGGVPLFVRTGGPRLVEFIGGRDAHLADIALAPGENGDVSTALAARVAAHGADFADLFGFPAESPLLQEFNGSVRVLQRVESPVLDLGDGDWSSIYAGRMSRKTRQTHRRKERRLADLGRLDIELATTPDEIDAILDETFRVHELRWSGRPDGSGIGTAAGQELQRIGYRALAERGMARVLAMRLDGTMIAFNAYMVFARRLYLHRLAFDPAYGRWSPGLLTTLRMCELAAQEKLERVEFLGGDEDYKVALADRFEPMHQAIGLARTLRGRASAMARFEGILLRRRLKRSQTLRRVYFEGLAPARRALARVRSR